MHLKLILKFTFLILLVIFSSCTGDQLVYKSIKFQNNYKFNDQIFEQIRTDTSFGKYQYASWEFSFKGNHKEALKQWDIGILPSVEQIDSAYADSLQQNYRAVNARDYIIEKSKENRVIIINEAHHNSRHRKFTKSLLQGLYKNGYRILLLEDLKNGQNKDIQLNNRGYPIFNTGFYVKDPQYGDLVRTALKLGYKVIPYEETDKAQGQLREQKQAENIKNIFKKFPNEKILIHCGFGHVFEGDFYSPGQVMAGLVKDYCNVDPLTINQTHYSEKSKSEFDPPLNKFLKNERPVVLINQDNNNPMKYTRGAAYTNMAVVYPRTKFINQRPDWLYEKNTRNISFNLANIKIDFPVLIMAFNNNENFYNAIPIDIVEVQTKSSAYDLLLKKGEYNIVIVNKKNDALMSKIEVLENNFIPCF